MTSLETNDKAATGAPKAKKGAKAAKAKAGATPPEAKAARAKKGATEARSNKKAEVNAMLKRAKGRDPGRANGGDGLAGAHGPRFRQQSWQQGRGEGRIYEERGR